MRATRKCLLDLRCWRCRRVLYLALHHIVAVMASKMMTEPAFMVLTALVDEPRHGYGIVRTVEELSRGRVRLKIGTLYGVLDRLAAEELVELDREVIHQGRVRRYYRLTDSGAGALEAETTRLAGNIHTARQRLNARYGRPSIAGGTA
jgi:PadR family transcriptional regulator PadR